MSNALTDSQLALFAKVFDFRTQFTKAARQILDGYRITATILGPGSGNQQVPRAYTSVDFQRGGADPTYKAPINLYFGGGMMRNSQYAKFTGILSILNSCPYETEPESGNAYITQDHARLLDELCAQESAIFMEALQPFTADFLPYLDIQRLVEIEPDERPPAEREVNIAMMRWRVDFVIRRGQFPPTA